MRIIKLILISGVIFFLLLTAMSLLVPSHLRISRAVNLSNKDNRILSFIEDTSHWSEWHPFFKGHSVQEVLQANQLQWERVQKTDSLFAINIKQGAKKPVLNSWQLHSLASTDSVALQWYMDFHLSWYPWTKFSSLLYERTYGSMMEQGLNDVKRILEQ